jgi:hypothetical protein
MRFLILSENGVCGSGVLSAAGMRCDITSQDGHPVLLALIPPGDWGELESWRAEADGRVSLRFAGNVKLPVDLLTPSAPPLLLLEQEGQKLQIPIARPLPKGWPPMRPVRLPSKASAGSMDGRILARRGVWRVEGSGTRNLDAEVFAFAIAGEHRDGWFQSGSILIALQDDVVVGVLTPLYLRVQAQLDAFAPSLPMRLEEATKAASGLWRKVAKQVLASEKPDPESVRLLALLRKVIALLRAAEADGEQPSRWLLLRPRGLMMLSKGGPRYVTGVALHGTHCRVEWRWAK